VISRESRIPYLTLSSALIDPALEACHFPHQSSYATQVLSYQHLCNSSNIPRTAQYILCVLLWRSALYQWNVEGLGGSIGSDCSDFASGGSNDRRVFSGAQSKENPNAHPKRVSAPIAHYRGPISFTTAVDSAANGLGCASNQLAFAPPPSEYLTRCGSAELGCSCPLSCTLKKSRASTGSKAVEHTN